MKNLLRPSRFLPLLLSLVNMALEFPYVYAGDFRIAVDVNQMHPDEARLIANTPGHRLRCDGLWGPIDGITSLDPEQNADGRLTPAEWTAFISKVGANWIVSEDLLGWDLEPALQWNLWRAVLGKDPNQGMVYSELGGWVVGTPQDVIPSEWQAPWSLSARPKIPGFVPNPYVVRPDWSTPAIWDICIDRSVVNNYVFICGRGKVVLLCRDFRDRVNASVNKPYRSHLIDGLRDPDTVGAAFEIGTSIDYLLGSLPDPLIGSLGNLAGRNIAIGIKEVLRLNKTCYLLLSPGDPNGRPYSHRVRAVVTELAQEGVPMNDSRLWFVAACYDRERSTVGFLSDDAGDNSVEAAINWLHSYRRN